MTVTLVSVGICFHSEAYSVSDVIDFLVSWHGGLLWSVGGSPGLQMVVFGSFFGVALLSG